MRGSDGLAFRAGGWRDAPARLEHGVDELEHGALVGGRELGDALQALVDAGVTENRRRSGRHS